jgi:hypothetical protein
MSRDQGDDQPAVWRPRGLSNQSHQAHRMWAGSWLLWKLDEHGKSVARAHASSPDTFESSSHEKGEARLARDGRRRASGWWPQWAGLGLNRAAMMPQGPVGILKLVETAEARLAAASETGLDAA